MKFLPNAITSKVATTALKLSKQSPHILFGAGVVGVVAAAVLASRATLKLENIVDEAKEKLEEIDSVSNHNEYSDEDRVKDKAQLYALTALKVTKLYGPAVLVGAASIGCLTGSHTVLTKRNAALTAAYAAIEKGFQQYRDRVIDDLGEEKDRQYRFGLEKHLETAVGEGGKKTQTETIVRTGRSPYGVIFHEGNPNWKPLPEYNYFFLRVVERSLNDRLNAKGYIFLKDVLEELGFEPTPASCVVGWLSEENGGKDGRVSLGVFDDPDQMRVHQYMVGVEGELYLDFNVDGVIYDKI